MVVPQETVTREVFPQSNFLRQNDISSGFAQQGCFQTVTYPIHFNIYPVQGQKSTEKQVTTFSWELRLNTQKNFILGIHPPWSSLIWALVFLVILSGTK